MNVSQKTSFFALSHCWIFGLGLMGSTALAAQTPTDIPRSINLTADPPSALCGEQELTVSWSTAGFVSCSRAAQASCVGTTWSTSALVFSNSGSQPELVCSPRPAPGNYPITLTCTDALGQSQSQTVQVAIGDSCDLLLANGAAAYALSEVLPGPCCHPPPRQPLPLKCRRK